MPTYRYRCPKGHDTLVWRSIHAATVYEQPCDHCGRIAHLHLASPAIAADALPNKHHGIRAANEREKRWAEDMPAYRRLRREGLQPRGIDGAAAAEAQANHPLEMEMGRPLGKARDIQRAQEIASELLMQDVTKTGAEIGAARREQRAVST